MDQFIMLPSDMSPPVMSDRDIPFPIMPSLITVPDLIPSMSMLDPERGAVQVLLFQYRISPVRSLRTAVKRDASQDVARAPAGASCANEGTENMAIKATIGTNFIRYLLAKVIRQAGHWPICRTHTSCGGLPKGRGNARRSFSLIEISGFGDGRVFKPPVSRWP